MYGLVGLVFLVLPIIAGIVGYGTASKRSSGIRRLGYLGRIAGLIVGTMPLVQLGIILWALLAPSRSLPSGRLAAAFD